MKTLVLVRHGAAEHSRSAGGDLERPLTPRGKTDSAQVADHFNEYGLSVNTILSSPALRAKITANYFADLAELPVRIDERIYEADVSELLDVVQEADDLHETILLVGHNPGFSEFLRLLLDREHDAMPTASLAIINMDVEEWVDVIAGSGELEWYIDPKIIAAEHKAA